MKSKTIKSDIPELITHEILREIVKFSGFINIGEKNRKLFIELTKKYSSGELSAYVSPSETLDGIVKSLKQEAFTGKELKEIIATHKMSQQNVSLFKIFHEIASRAVEIQEKKQEKRVISAVEIFAIMYIFYALNTDGKSSLLEGDEVLFYDNSTIDSVFEIRNLDSSNPFLNFLNKIGEVRTTRTESLLDTLKIDNLFYMN